MKPITGASRPDSNWRRENAPEVRARLQPNSRRMGRKNTWKPWKKTMDR